jgi:UrcA family protein
MTDSKLLNSLVAALFAIALGGPTVVLADTPTNSDDTAHTHISYADLNLDSEEGVQELHVRLRHASRKVCGVTSPMSSGTMAWRACYRNTLTNAVDKFNSEHHECMHAKLVVKRS